MKKEKKDIHVLVVDDLADGRETAVEYLQFLGYARISVAKDGNEALKALESDSSIDLVLSDWDMPIVDGITLLRQVRSHAKWEHLPFIMMTSPRSFEPSKISQAIEGLVDDYIMKPFRIATLEEKLTKVLSLSVHGPQKMVLVVDDEADSREMVVEYLKRYGFKRIQTHNDGLSALEFLRTHPEDVGLIIADWEMPKMKGVELLSHCRSSPVLKEIPFFMITSQMSVEKMKVSEAAKFQVDEYLLKPFTKDDLQARIDGVLDRKRFARQVEAFIAEGFAALDRGRTKAAQQAFEQALALDPNYDLVLSGMADALFAQNNVDGSVPFYFKAVTLNPRRAENYLKLARAYMKLDHHGKAINLLQAGIQAVPSDPDLTVALAEIYLEKNMMKKVVEECLVVLQKFPEHEKAKELVAKAKVAIEEKALTKKNS